MALNRVPIKSVTPLGYYEDMVDIQIDSDDSLFVLANGMQTHNSRLSALVFGPVVSVIETTTLKPRISFFQSKAKPKGDYKSWVGAFKWMVHNPQRNKEIVQQVFKDLRGGHNVIIIPVDYKAHVNHLVKMINHQAKMNASKRDENWPSDLAQPFYAGVSNRQDTLSWVDSVDENPYVKDGLPTKSPRVLVAVRSMVRQGIDLKRPSALYVVMPMSANKAVGAPMFTQLAFRVATPYSDKPEPLVRVWIDNVNMFKSCVSGLLWNEIFPKSSIKLGMEDCDYLLTSAEVELAKRATAKEKKKEKGDWW